MNYLTDRKRAEGLGASRGGTHEHWQAMVTSMLLVILVPLFVITFGLGLGGSYEEVLAYYARPCPAIITGLTLVVGILHMMREVREAVEDYMHGLAEKLMLVAVAAFSYTMIAVGLFALVKLAL
ncbi:succinate dehydrogenase, hydrophobic membrane anchor protein [Phaeobacter sp. HF9A]|uniref:succinate dehydrogenase, hydrophobic membrane anchor protein n=1 Tax=Phaeobacter sp. HF9A TaxID=2721561 RepID=UPI001431A645|nr:succinate dehydrogenase, hydrophobic membrane anchor protein [Phaeobacter sp. HF9A]NIZ12886.1 succinate dehydrogenase, hydrophobic membrane anchor protein [Phaeobacter sp. HF9A]